MSTESAPTVATTAAMPVNEHVVTGAVDLVELKPPYSWGEKDGNHGVPLVWRIHSGYTLFQFADTWYRGGLTRCADGKDYVIRPLKAITTMEKKKLMRTKSERGCFNKGSQLMDFMSKIMRNNDLRCLDDLATVNDSEWRLALQTGVDLTLQTLYDDQAVVRSAMPH